MHMSDLENYIELYGRDLYSFCCYLTRSRGEADDLYQDTFLTAAEISGRLDVNRNPKSALLSIAVNLWRNRRRKMSLRRRITGPVASLDSLRVAGGDRAPAAGTFTASWDSDFGSPVSGSEPASDTPDPLDTVIASEEARAVRQAVARLHDRYRIPVLLFYMEDMKIPEIAAALRIPQGTVKSRLHKAKKLLEQDLKEVLDET